MHVCAHASSKAPSRQPLPYEPCPDQTRQQRPNKCLRPVPAPLAPSLARPSRSAPAQTYLTLHNTNCRSNKSPQSLFHCAAAAYESLIMRRYHPRTPVDLIFQRRRRTAYARLIASPSSRRRRDGAGSRICKRDQLVRPGRSPSGMEKMELLGLKRSPHPG